MARIRTIKPEFPQSESMGRVSRESRYCFILLWTLADDSGRLRGNSRMLASLLFPYDLDAGKLIDKWLGELEQEKCLIKYAVEDDTYIQICNWLKHQKIDRPSASKIPPFQEDSRILAKPRESSCEDQGSRNVSKDQGKDHIVAPEGVSVEVWDSFVQQRKKTRGVITPTVMKNISAEAAKANWTLEQALAEISARGWRGFKAEWVQDKRISKAQQQQDRMIATALEWAQESK
jgi:hypothetical protein